VSARPAWLPPFHEVERARPGRPTQPVPFILLAGRHVYAWDPDQGLLRLPRAEPESSAQEVTSALDDLSSDGTQMRYRRRPPGESLGHGRVDLRSGAVTVAPYSHTEVYEAGPGGPLLRAEPPPYGTAHEDLHYRYEVVDAPDAVARVLPLRDLLLSYGAPAAQFSPTGRLLLTSHRCAADSRHYVVCTEVATGRKVRELDDAHLIGTASWSPDETRVLVRHGAPRVFRLDTGEDTWVKPWPIERDEPTGPALVDALGWLGNDGILVSKRHGRRFRLSYQPLDNSARYPVLDIPVPASQGDTLGIALAPAVLCEAPQLIGFQPR
jgi:hypothetical protein